MKFDASTLTDDDLVVLETTLRVQLEVSKHVRVVQVSAAIGAGIVTAGLSAVVSCPSIVYSAVQRRKCKRRFRLCHQEMQMRGLTPAPVDHKRSAQLVLAMLAVGGGLACCVLGVAMDLCIDQEVLRVVSDFFTGFVNDKIAGGIAALVEIRAAAMVGMKREALMKHEEIKALFGGETASKEEDEKKEKKTRSPHKAKSWSTFKDKLQKRRLQWKAQQSLPVGSQVDEEEDCDAATLFGTPLSMQDCHQREQEALLLDQKVQIVQCRGRGQLADCFVVKARNAEMMTNSLRPTTGLAETFVAEQAVAEMESLNPVYRERMARAAFIASDKESREHAPWELFWDDVYEPERPSLSHYEQDSNDFGDKVTWVNDEDVDDCDAFTLFGPPMPVTLFGPLPVDDTDDAGNDNNNTFVDDARVEQWYLHDSDDEGDDVDPVSTIFGSWRRSTNQKDNISQEREHVHVMAHELTKNHQCQPQAYYHQTMMKGEKLHASLQHNESSRDTILIEQDSWNYSDDGWQEKNTEETVECQHYYQVHQPHLSEFQIETIPALFPSYHTQDAANEDDCNAFTLFGAG